MESNEDLKFFGGSDAIKRMHKESLIDTSVKVKFPPCAISIGYFSVGTQEYNNPFGTYGNFSVVSGMGKVRKSFFISTLIAAYIGGNSNAYASDFKGHWDGNKSILHFDTEQGDWHAQNCAVRVEKLVGNKNPKYFPKKLRKWGAKERVEYIEWCILNSHYKRDGIGLVIIDGIADLVTDVNSLVECNELIQKLMMWTEVSNCHLITVIHTNFDSKKATGHLGSAVMKKAETVCIITATDQESEVEFKMTRGSKIDNIAFHIDSDGLPHVTQPSII